MSYQKIKRLFYGFAFFDDFILIYPLYAVMFAEKGLSAAQISSLFIAWSLTGFLLEVPSGAVADKYPRKTVLQVAVGIRSLAFLAWLIEPSYIGFLTGFVLWGVSTALISGTEEALVYDELTRAKKTSDYSKVTGRMESLRLIAFIVASFAAAALANHGYTIILMLSFGAVLLSAVMIALLPKAKPVESTGETKYLSYLKTGVQLVLHNRKILLLIGFAATVVGLGSVDEYYSLFFDEIGYSNAAIALLMGVVFLIGAAGSSLAYKFEDKKIPLGLALFLASLVLFTSTLSMPYLSPLLIGLYLAFTYIVGILFNTYLQREATDRNRATMTSVQGLATEFFALVTFGLFALTSQFGDYSLGLQIVAIVMAMVAMIYTAMSKYLPT